MSRQTQEYNHAWQQGYEHACRELRREFQASADDVALFGLVELSALLLRHEGYIRIGASLDNRLWVRYKWTMGVREGLYTFSSDSSLGCALAQVCVHAAEVESGKRKASRDNPRRKG